MTTLAAFNGSNGANPHAGLILSGSTLYGTTVNGGASGDGTVFSVPVGGGSVTTLEAFNGSNGSYPYAGLILSGDGSAWLYGTTYQGGASGDGTVFKITTNAALGMTLATFNGTNGANPWGGLILSGDGSALYGTTYQGGASGDGTVFSGPVGGGSVTTLASFNGTNGEYPYAGLILSGSNLCGTTVYGGASNEGAVFSLNAARRDAGSRRCLNHRVRRQRHRLDI